MTRTLTAFAGVALAVVAVGLAQPARGDQSSKVAYVVAADRPAAVERFRAAAVRDGAPLRVPLTASDQLGVTHLLAAAGYDEVITFGVDRRIAIDPVAARYPETRFTAAAPSTRAP